MRDGEPTVEEEKISEVIRLDNRYDMVHLCFEFLLSALILLGGFYILIIYHDPNISSGVVAISTLVISYWFGKARPGR